MLKARQEPCEHRLGGVAQIVAELEFAEVFRKMLPADMNMRASDRTFEHGPEPLNGVHVMDTVYPLVRRVVDGAVIVSEPGDPGIGGKLVRADRRPALDVLKDVPLQSRAAYVRDDASHDIAAALDHAEHYRLARRPTSALATRTPSADVGFIGLNVPAQRGIAVHVRHVFADLMAHAPSRLVGHAQLALKFLGGHAMALRGEQVHGVEPLLQRCVRPFEGRPDHRVNVMPARRAGISWKLLELGELALGSALRAVHRVAETKHHKVLKARFVSRELLEKVLDGWGFGHVRNLLYPQYGYPGFVRQGDNRVLFCE